MAKQVKQQIICQKYPSMVSIEKNYFKCIFVASGGNAEVVALYIKTKKCCPF